MVSYLTVCQYYYFVTKIVCIRGQWENIQLGFCGLLTFSLLSTTRSSWPILYFSIAAVESAISQSSLVPFIREKYKKSRSDCCIYLLLLRSCCSQVFSVNEANICIYVYNMYLYLHTYIDVWSIFNKLNTMNSNKLITSNSNAVPQSVLFSFLTYLQLSSPAIKKPDSYSVKYMYLFCQFPLTPHSISHCHLHGYTHKIPSSLCS